MSIAEELVAHIRDGGVPDKRRILRTRELANALARDIPDAEAARRLVQKLNNAFLVLQLATLSDDPDTERRCRADCLAMVLAIERARPNAARLAS